MNTDTGKLLLFSNKYTDDGDEFCSIEKINNHLERGSNFSYEECRKYHYEIWDFLYKNPGGSKRTWIQNQNFSQAERNCLAIHFDCFACIVADGNCDICPLISVGNCGSPTSAYSLWGRTARRTTKRHMAKRIRDAWRRAWQKE